MNNYIENLNDELKKYYKILCNNVYPEFINKYIDLPELQRLSKIGQFCGCDYTKIYSVKYWYSRLDHSIACALMTWNFTKDKTQTLLALFHDMGTPAFSHCVDYLLDDYINQESSEKDIYKIINSSNTIKKYLVEDLIDIQKMSDISVYTIVENKKPKICVDRLEGVLSTCLIWLHCWDINRVKKAYQNITVLKNEYNEDELGFNNIQLCENFFEGVNKYSIELQKNEDKYIMQFFADMLKKLLENNCIKIEQLYNMSEQEVINILSSKYETIWNVFKNANTIIRSDIQPNNVYHVSISAKKRYVNPLCKNNNKINRLDEISSNCKTLLDKYMNFEDSKYAYINGINI